MDAFGNENHLCLPNQWSVKLNTVSDGMLKRNCYGEKIFHGEKMLKGMCCYK